MHLWLSVVSARRPISGGFNDRIPDYSCLWACERETSPQHFYVGGWKDGSLGLRPDMGDVWTLQRRPWAARWTSYAGYPLPAFSVRRASASARGSAPLAARRPHHRFGCSHLGLLGMCPFISASVSRSRQLDLVGWATLAAGSFSGGRSCAPHKRERLFILLARAANLATPRACSGTAR